MSEVIKMAKCSCGETSAIPGIEQRRLMKDNLCDDPDCTFLNKCRDCQPKYFLTRFCNCDCDNCTIVKRFEVEHNPDANKVDFGITGCHRIPKGERWNVALGEYCTTTQEVEKHRKKQGKHYVPNRGDGPPPKPYVPSDSEDASEKRKEFAKKGFSVGFKRKDEQ
jgi:hypothetical protein